MPNLSQSTCRDDVVHCKARTGIKEGPKAKITSRALQTNTKILR